MEEVKFIDYKGKKILKLDFTKSTGNFSDDIQKTLDIIKETYRVYETQELKSVLMLTNITGTRFNSDIVTAFGNITKDLDSKIKAVATVGLGGLQKVVFNFVKGSIQTNMQLFDTEAEAFEWLANF